MDTNSVQPAPSRIDHDIPVAERTFVHLLAERQIWPIFLFRALALQGTHPTVMAALEEHSKSFSEPSVRTANTLAYTYRIYFGTDVADAARNLREMHRPITGEDYLGRRYHAWNRDVWTWVHLTTIESMLYAISVCFGPQPEADVESFYQESRRLGTLFGVREQDMPADVSGLRRYVDAGIDEKLAMSPGTERMHRLIQEQSATPLLGRGVAVLPHRVQLLLIRVTSRPVQTLIFGNFPDHVRRIWGIRWTTARQREFAVLLALIRTCSRLAPERFRLVPEAREALRR